MAFISEIHYRNTVASSTGVSEYVEITLSPDELLRASEFHVATYQTDGTVRDLVTLSDLTPTLDPTTGFYVFEIVTPVTDPDHLTAHNEAEAVALVDTGGAGVLTFVDIGGGTTGITATEGPANGSTSATIPAATGGQSIQFDAFGNRVDGPLSQGSSVVCLTRGTLIGTSDGSRPVEDLRAGDRIITRDHGMQPLRMVHSRTITGAEFQDNRNFWPVRIAAGALGFGLPVRDLWVSPQHRMLISHIRFSLLYNDPDVLVRAKSLCGSFEHVCVDQALTEVTYFHLVFDRHEIIYAESAPTESFHPGQEGVAGLSHEARTELYEIFPSLRVGAERPEATYQTLRAWEVIAAVA